MAATDKVRKAVPEDLSQISTALSRAFLDDPVMSWAILDEQRRQRILPDFFSLYTEVFLRHDESYPTREEVIDAALWAPPGRLPVSGEDAEDFGRRMEEMAGVDAPRFLEVGKLVDDYHPHGSYYYLQFLGVAPGRQGQGIGAALMARFWSVATARACARTWRPPASAARSCTSGMGSRRRLRSLLPGGRRYGRCGDSRLQIASDFWSWCGHSGLSRAPWKGLCMSRTTRVDPTSERPAGLGQGSWLATASAGRSR